MNVKIGSFNCLNFGRNSSNKKDVDLIAKIIRNENFDIIALQEIKHPEVVEYITQKLNMGNSKGVWKGYADKEENDYAFLWNEKSIVLPSVTLADGTKRTFYPHIYKQYGRDPELGKINLARPPFYGRFQTNYPGLPKIELRLINTHIRFSKGTDGKELAPSISEIELRKYEFKALTKNIYYRISDKIYGRQDGESNPLTAYTILLGDFNLNLKESGAGSPHLAELEAITITNSHNKNKTKFIVTKQTGLTTLKKKNDNEDTDAVFFANNYDHFTYDENRFNGTTKRIIKVNSVEKYCNNDPKKHIENISDHTPIKMTLSIKKG